MKKSKMSKDFRVLDPLPGMVLTPDVVLAVRQPVPLNRVARYLRGWSKAAYAQVRGEFLVVIEPSRIQAAKAEIPDCCAKGRF